MKNILDQAVRTELLSRVDKLTPESKAVWGKMNVNQGLRHMTYAFGIATGEMKIAPRKAPLPKFLMKYFLINFKPPKGRAETFVEVNLVKNKIYPTDFFAEKKALREVIMHFGEKPMLPKNPMGVPLSKDEWGKLNYNHTDHHLRQFGA